jgi:predicted molibdopterin-dependent oxidoreductase YjgC
LLVWTGHLVKVFKDEKPRKNFSRNAYCGLCVCVCFYEAIMPSLLYLDVKAKVQDRFA